MEPAHQGQGGEERREAGGGEQRQASPGDHPVEMPGRPGEPEGEAGGDEHDEGCGEPVADPARQRSLPPRIEGAARHQRHHGEDRDRRHQGQHVMRELGRNRLEQEPGGDDPGEQEGRGILAPVRPGQRKAQSREGRARPEGREEHDEIGARGRPVLLGGAPDLGEHVPAHRGAEEGTAALARDGEEPGRHDEQGQPEPEGRPQSEQPGARADAQGQEEGGQADEERHHRPLHQDAQRHGDPEQEHAWPAEVAPAPPDPGPGEPAHGGDAAGGQNGVGLGEMRLGREHQAGGEQGGGHDCPAPGREDQGGPVGQQTRRHRAEQRGDAVEGDGGAGTGHAERFAGRDSGGLHPVDPHRLLVAGLGLEADVDEVAGLQHLLRRLGKARLVAVHRLERGKTGQEAGEAEREEDRAGMGVAAGTKAEDGVEDAWGIAPVPGPAGREADHGRRFMRRP